MKKSCIFLFSFLFLIASCKENKNQQIRDLVEEWDNKIISFSPELQFTSLGEEVPSLLGRKWDYAIVSYTDSIGCTSCKLQLRKWQELILQRDSTFDKKVEILLFLHPSDHMELLSLLKEYKFNYPVCIDDNDTFNKLNNFPANITFQTFLIDSHNKVLAIGNPIHNSKVKKLYLNIIQSKEVQSNATNSTFQTNVSVDNISVSLGYFNWQEEQKTNFIIKNVGSKPLVIQDVNTSCGCTTVTYSQEPVQPGKEIKLEIIYKADHPEHFSKTITVYCNSELSPIKFTISGDAQ